MAEVVAAEAFTVEVVAGFMEEAVTVVALTAAAAMPTAVGATTAAIVVATTADIMAAAVGVTGMAGAATGAIRVTATGGVLDLDGRIGAGAIRMATDIPRRILIIIPTRADRTIRVLTMGIMGAILLRPMIRPATGTTMLLLRIRTRIQIQTRSPIIPGIPGGLRLRRGLRLT
jgi:hypothetical protein